MSTAVALFTGAWIINSNTYITYQHGRRNFVMYQALYRKWRPQTFADVIGQQHITDTQIGRAHV